ncbi:Nup133 N terminal like-domain-containing protein, partial [Mucor mucedo]|uniref:Nup133 N terminal like-domain-containing protein n=1 Tax=Mucor mucedo TaxID=29922 RepID=UPI002220C8D6
MNNTIVGSVNPSFKEYGDSLVTLIKSNQESIDLADHLRDSDSEVYAKDNQHVFSKIATTQFPESLQVEGLDPQYKMGFLPSIKQVWLATSTSLYIWNYVDNTEVFKYENTEAIENAEMLTFRHHQELVVSTAHHIFVHSIQQDDNNKLKIVSNACVKTDSVIMSEFVVTDKQRVFMRGSDGHLYELNYKTGVNHYISSGTLICHTENPIVKYFSFLRYVPKASVKSLVVDNDQEFLYYLLNDSSIHSVDIGGSVYLPNQRFNGAQLESLHLIPKSESTKVNLMAISNKGERLYFSCKDKKIDLIYTRTSPPLPGSLLFNDLTKETCDLSFYNHGVFAAVLGKSKRSYLVMTNANSIPDENGLPLMVEDVYNESVDKKIWSIIESNPKDTSTHHYFKETTESPESPARRFSTLTDAGITHYIKQRPVDYLSEAVASDAPIKRIAFLNRYGPIETSAMTLLLACSSHQSPRVFQFLQTLHNMNEGLLLYFSRIVGNIWTTDILKETIRQDQFISARENLGKLIACIEETNMDVKDDIVNLIKRTMEAIKFVCFMHNSGWEKIRQSLPTTCKLFGDMVTTEEGALLAKEMVFAAIKTTELSNNLNDYNHVSNFLKVNCNNFLGNINTVYYQGMECLQAACNDTNNGASLRFSLDHFKKIINFIELDTLQTLCQEYGRLGYHIGAIELAHS